MEWLHWGCHGAIFLELDRSLSNQTEKMVLQLSNTSVQEIDGILKNVCIGAWDFYCLKR